MNLQSLISWIKPIAVTVGSALLSGAGQAAVQYLQSGGQPTNYKALGGAALTGAIVGLGALYIKPPAATTAAPTITPIPPVPSQKS